MSVQQKKQAFIDIVKEGAQEVQKATGMFASVTIAQAIHETGWGRSTPKDKDTGAESHNLFGRKVKKGEPFVTSRTWEVYDGKRVEIFAKFKKFNSYTESVMDRSSFLKSKYYKKACAATNPYDACDFLIKTGVFNEKGQEIGYATDPSYAELLKKVIRQNNLEQYDLPKQEKVAKKPPTANQEVKKDEKSTKTTEKTTKKAETATKTPEKTAQKGEITLKKEDANELIKVCQEKWAESKTKVEKDKWHKLANALRKASGQEK